MSCHAHELAEARRLLLSADVDLIREAVRMVAPSFPLFLALDLGAGSGTSALSVFCERSDAHVITVDTNPVALASTRELLTNYGYVDRWLGIEADSCDFLAVADAMVGHPQLVNRGAFDFLMVDSSHEYAHTVSELNTWLPALRAGALVWCHDYDHGRAARLGLDSYPGVAKAVDEAVEAKRLQPLKTGGLGWLGMAVR